MKIENEMLNRLAEDLPIIRPIKEFVHLNLLLPYQNQDFWSALKCVSEKFESYTFNPISFYQEQLATNFIKEEKLKERLQLRLGDEGIEGFNLFIKNKIQFTHYDPRIAPMHESWSKQAKINLTELSDGILIKWLSSFLDQGIGDWEMPESSNLSFYHVVSHLLRASILLPAPFSKKLLEEYLPHSAEESIERTLAVLCPHEELQESYLRECVMTLRGWAGLVRTLETIPGLLSFQRKIDLTDFLAIKLFLEVSWIKQTNSKVVAPSFISKDRNASLSHIEFETLRALQECYEEETFQEMIDSLKEAKITEKEISYQAIFCMDDRESPLRTYAEEYDKKLQTFGTAAHFGLEIMYQHSDYAFAKKQCPAPATPKYHISEKSHSISRPEGLFSYFKKLFFPIIHEKLQGVEERFLNTELKVHRGNESDRHNGLKSGYSLDEMADVVYSQLKLIGLMDLAHLILVVGHGSTSSNNPYFATYGCGACSGRAGSANSRSFAFMANHPEVRKIIQSKYSFEIPETVYFLAGFHDTTRDLIEIYNPDSLPSELRSDYAKLKETLEFAVQKNATNRSKLFKLTTHLGLKETRLRAKSLFEPRPELGHTNVAYSIVGRRDLLKNLKLNRPAFFQSYDYRIDPDSKILASSLGAVIPVTSGINLDYYFSAVDNTRFGAGSKLPQNVVGHFGVSHGTESDLRFGLPLQMVDQHQATRIFILVEQTPVLAMRAIESHPLVNQIVSNHWIYYGCFDPYTKDFSVFFKGEMKKVKRLEDVWN